MDKNELERRLEAAEKQMIGLQDEIQNLKSHLAEMQDEPEIPDFPVYISEPLYFMSSRFEIVGSENNLSYGAMDGDFNAFHTKEMAQEFTEKCKLIAMIMHCKWYLDRDYVPNWKNIMETKFIVSFNYLTNRFELSIRTSLDSGCVAFSSAETAMKCADWLNDHWKENENG